jgi:hypothetical protein
MSKLSLYKGALVSTKMCYIFPQTTYMFHIFKMKGIEEG